MIRIVRGGALAVVLLGYTAAAIAAGKSPAVDKPLASKIDYTLPAMSVTVTVEMTLKSCKAAPEVEPSVTITPAIGPESYDEYHFIVDAAYLQSFTRDKNLSIETFPNGTIKSVGGGATDQSMSILTSAIKLAVSLVAVAGPAQHLSMAGLGACNKDTTDALDAVTKLTSKIDDQRKVFVTGAPDAVARAQAAITVYASEIARLKTGALHLALPAVTMVLDDGRTGQHVEVTRAMLTKWLLPGAAGSETNKVDSLELGICALKASDVLKAGAPTCTGAMIDASIASLKQKLRTDRNTGQLIDRVPVEQPNCDGGPACPQTLVFREPVNAVVVVAPEGDGYGTEKIGAVLARLDLPVSQWGKLSYVPIKAGWGKSVTFGITLDTSGHRLSQNWSYKARGTGILGGAAGVADVATSLYKTVDGKTLADQKAEVDALTTQKNLNQLRFCKAVIDAGGFTCPTQ